MSTNSAKRAALYLRQSRTDKTGDGPERQLQRTRQLADLRGWIIAGEYRDDGVSASKARGIGTAWDRMLSDADAGRIDVVVGVDLDRLLRSTRDLNTLIDRGLQVVTVDGEIDLSTADGEFRATMLAGIARFEVRRKTERQHRANDQRAAKGIPHGRPRVFGYDADGVTPLEVEAAPIRDGYAHILAGGTVRALTQRWNLAGLRTVRGNAWNGTEVRRVLLRERNAGILIVRGVAQEASTITPIVDFGTYQAVSAILSDPARNLRGRPTGERWLSGVMQCTCGLTMQVGQSWSGGVSSPAYSCQAIRLAERNGAKREGRHAQIVARVVEAGVWGHLLALLIAEALSDSDAVVPEDADVIRLRATLSRIEADRRAVQEMYLIPGADRAHLTARITEMGSEHEEAKRGLDDALSRRSAADIVSSVRAAVSRVLTDSPDDDDEARGRAIRSEWESLPAEVKRQVVATKLSIVVAPGGKGSGHGMRRVEVTPLNARSVSEAP